MLYIYIDNCIGGVMVSVLALSAHNRVRVVELILWTWYLLFLC